MSVRTFGLGIAALLIAVTPVAAQQQRGTVEFGGFASSTSYDESLGMNRGLGWGGRVGAFLHPRLSIEFEGGTASASRDQGLNDVNVGILSARLTAIPARLGRVSFLLGAGIDHTDTYFLESYGGHGLLGAKVRLWDAGDLRLDWIQTYMSNGKGTNRGLHLGMSVYRQPHGRTVTLTRTVAGPSVTQRPDSVSAAETRRLRVASASYDALRDSLSRASSGTPSSAAALATMQEMIYFQHDRADLSDSAKAILNDKVTVFRANPAMRIVISGFASEPGTDAYNMALGLRRAEAAKAYLVSRGVDPIRIEIATRGSGQLLVEGPGEAADAANRRGQFRLLIADPHLAPPKR